MALKVRANSVARSIAGSSVHQDPGSSDPWNWAMPNRSDLMNLNTLKEDKDLIKVKLMNGLRTKRQQSANMRADDITGAAPKIEIPR